MFPPLKYNFNICLHCIFSIDAKSSGKVPISPYYGLSDNECPYAYWFLWLNYLFSYDNFSYVESLGKRGWAFVGLDKYWQAALPFT